MRIWFNRHFALVARVVRQLRDATPALPVTALISHRHSHFIGFAEADEAFVEPNGLPPDAYLQWCLEVAARRRIEYLVPGSEQSLLTANAAAFRAVGCRVIHSAPADILPLLHRKNWVYENCGQWVDLPPYRVVTDPGQLAGVVEELEREHDEVCIKPCVSIYGKGFGRITAQAARAGTDRDHVEHWLTKNVRDGRCAPQLVMQFLPGSEYSVDVAARDGELLAAVVRRKPITGAGQLLQHNPVLVEAARRLVAHFKLNAMVNVQFRDDPAGQSRLLEINPRASGGIGMSCLSGINLPDIAIRAALSANYTVPVLTPRLGVRVDEMPRAVIVPEAEPEILPQFSRLAETAREFSGGEGTVTRAPTGDVRAA